MYELNSDYLSYSKPCSEHIFIERFSGNSLKSLKHCLTHALCKVKRLVRGLNDNKALEFVLCFISMLASCLML